MNIYEEGGLDLQAAFTELEATGSIQNDGVRRGRMAELSAGALLDIAGSLRVLAAEAAGAMGVSLSTIVEDAEAEEGPRDFLVEGDLVHRLEDTEPGEVVALGFDGDGDPWADVEFGGGPVRLYVSSLVRLVGDEARDLEVLDALKDLPDVGDELEDGTDPDLYDLPDEPSEPGPEDAVEHDIDADFGDEPHPLAESAVDVLRANEAARKAAKKKGGKK